MEGPQYEIEDSFLYGLDEDSIRVMFRELYSNSAFIFYHADVVLTQWNIWRRNIFRDYGF
ncbi:MAG: hypothetical protein ACLRWM_00790 [Streptococcus sp.]